MLIFFHKKYFILDEAIRTVCIQYTLNTAKQGDVGMMSK